MAGERPSMRFRHLVRGPTARAGPWAWAAPAGLCGSLPAGCGAGLEVAGFSVPGDAILLLSAGALLKAVVLGLVLLTWERLGRKRRMREHLRRELRYLRQWADTAGVLRKAGLIHDLNALGWAPAELEACVLNGAELKGARLAGCRMRAANLSGADLQGADLDGADLFGADLSQANLTLASLRGANLRGANLEGAALVKAELDHANLHRANLLHADLHGTRLEGVRLERARFAHGEEGLLRQIVHPSVEDWIRARLDERGCYREAAGLTAGEAARGTAAPSSLPPDLRKRRA